jgi:transposase InsO family protein
MRAQADRQLLPHIERIHRDHRGHCGAVKTWRVLQQQGIAGGKHRVARLRREHGIVAKRRRRFMITRRSKQGIWHAPNLLARRFTTDRPDRVWVGDVTHIATRQGWLYLAVLIDLYARRVVGWCMRRHNDTDLVLGALAMAMTQRQVSAGLIHHSDQGRPYVGKTYQARLASAQIQPSMSRRGECWDNAVAESFFATLEFELIERQVFESRAAARAAIFEFIEVFYNRQRFHQTLAYKTPLLVEQEYRNVA